jgi:hypothetical protein
MTIGCVGLTSLPIMSQGQVFDVSQAREHILEIASADDFEDSRLADNWEKLKRNSDRLFPLWVELIRSSKDDRVLQITLSTAESSAATKRNELNDLATQLLDRLDSDSLPLAAERALHTLGKFGGGPQVATVQSYINHSNATIQSAAKKALEALTDRPAHTPRSTLPSSTQTIRPSSSKPSTTNQTREIINAPRSLMSWSAVAVLIVVAVGMLCLFLKGRK